MAYAVVAPTIAVTSISTSVQAQVLGSLASAAVSTGWSVIENGYNDGTYVRYVFRSPAADFHTVFFFSVANYNTNLNNTGNTGVVTSVGNNAFLGFTVSEGYNATTHNLIRPAVCLTGTTVACSATDDSVGSGEISLASTISTYGVMTITPSSGYTWSTGGTWYANVLSDTLTLAWGTNVSVVGIGQGSFTGGKATSVVTSSSTNDAYPYYASYNLAYIFPTRSAMNAGKPAHIWSLVPQLFGVTSGAANTAGGYDLYQAGPIFSPVVAYRSNAGTDRATYGGVRFKMHRILFSGTSSGVLIGDTFTVNGTVYVYIGTPASSPWIQRG